MITLSNGHSFTFMSASGALAFDGRGWPWEGPLRWVGLIDPTLFTIVTKTLTRQPRKGNLRWYNPLRCVRYLPKGAVNAIGLTNPGIEWWCRKVRPNLDPSYRIIASIEAEQETEVTEMIRMIEIGKKNLTAIELNASCPNTPQEGQRRTEKTIRICRAASQETDLPLILKLGVTHDYLTLSHELRGTIDAISINSVPWGVIFPKRKSPLHQFGGGGVSGKIAQRWTWEMAKRLATQGPLPVIGPSPWDYEDIQKLFDMGAGAVSFGSVFLWHPWRPTLFVRRWFREHQISRFMTTASS